MTLDIAKVNADLNTKDPLDVVRWAVEYGGDDVICSTNFRPQEAVILHMVTQVKPDIPILWADGGYALPETYRFAEKLITEMNLNMRIFNPLLTSARREAIHGPVPGIEDEAAHDLFTQQVKIEPFKRGLAELQPKVWLTAIRADQTPHRATLDIVSGDPDDVLKVSPVFHFDDAAMDAYLAAHNLPDETTYFDPTKVESERECGLHVVDGKLVRANA
ncbi:MAG: phosphoadenosine phosphosulfate reductase family protein [Lentisphaeria bacterium]|nr:phosphoadenosine phosphosulfate reductase family protein [Lentisphaeria bacterium]NQZ67933.1 phosphoadenosine phosphosulfate reductase family protein [Lentisphaeria bacterium]